jgi:branched-chain amino acid transport system permease protein
MNTGALLACVTSSGCLATQTIFGAVLGLLLFLVASGVTLIFGVLGIVNFAHGSFYMLGAFMAYTLWTVTGSVTITFLGSALAVGVLGLLLERLFFARIYHSTPLMQLLVSYAFVLIIDDLVPMIWGDNFLSIGIPPSFRGRPVFVLGGPVPLYYLFLIGVASLIALCLAILVSRTRWGLIIRAVAVNPTMVGNLGISGPLVYASVFFLGSCLAGGAGALAAPFRGIQPGMGLDILIDCFVVTIIGGMGSIGGALLASVGIGLLRAFGNIAFPLWLNAFVFLVMILFLVARPKGLFSP